MVNKQGVKQDLTGAALISGDICVSCIKIHSTGYITFIKLFNFENNNCIHNSKAK